MVDRGGLTVIRTLFKMMLPIFPGNKPGGFCRNDNEKPICRKARTPDTLYSLFQEQRPYNHVFLSYLNLGLRWFLLLLQKGWAWKWTEKGLMTSLFMGVVASCFGHRIPPLGEKRIWKQFLWTLFCVFHFCQKPLPALFSWTQRWRKMLAWKGTKITADSGHVAM